ncbi:MAG: hypothetical protein LBI33_07565, partial [Propionibacteriaceae bacterium]|nr:hypothetical protein [Propionibacteriaceae bacterium]
VSLDVRARRQVEADASKPRATARWVTIITATVLGALFFTGQYVEPYKTGLGQLLLFALLGAYGAVLVWMKRLATSPTTVRYLGQPGGPGQSQPETWSSLTEKLPVFPAGGRP